MATGQRKTGEVVGGEIRVVMNVGSMDGMVCSPSSIWVADELFVSLPCDYGYSRCFSFLTLSRLLSSFSSLLCLLSCLRAIVIPLFVLLCFDPIPPLFCSLNPVSYYAQFIAQSGWVFCLLPLIPIPSPSFLRALLLPFRLVPDRRATAYCTYVFSSEV